MKVFIDELNGDPLFSMEVNSSDTVLQMKQKIHKCTGHSVSEQALFFKGEVLLEAKDNHTLQECGIVHETRFNFFHPSIPNDKNIKEVGRHQYQTPQSSVDFANIVRCSPDETTNLKEICLNKNRVFQREERINDQDSLERISNTRPRNLRVMVSTYPSESPDRRTFVVDVNEDDKVEELKRELFKIQGINLPPDGYFFSHKHNVLDENQSFRNNGVASLDLIQIYPIQTRQFL